MTQYINNVWMRLDGFHQLQLSPQIIYITGTRGIPLHDLNCHYIHLRTIRDDTFSPGLHHTTKVPLSYKRKKGTVPAEIQVCNRWYTVQLAQ